MGPICPKYLDFMASFEVVPPQWKIQNFKWAQAYNLSIGKGYSAKPSIPQVPSYFSKLTSFLTDEMPLSLILKGSGTPNVQEVKFNWQSYPKAPSFLGSEVKFTNTLNPITASIKLGVYGYYWLFYNGTAQVESALYDVFIFWRICYDGPFVSAPYKLAKELPPKWVNWITMIRSDLEKMISAFDPCIEKPWLPQCLKIKYPKIGKAALEMKEMPVPENMKELRTEITENLEQINAELADCSLLLNQLRKIRSEEKGVELRTAIGDHFERARGLAINIIRHFGNWREN